MSFDSERRVIVWNNHVSIQPVLDVSIKNQSSGHQNEKKCMIRTFHAFMFAQLVDEDGKTNPIKCVGYNLGHGKINPASCVNSCFAMIVTPIIMP